MGSHVGLTLDEGRGSSESALQSDVGGTRVGEGGGRWGGGVRGRFDRRRGGFGFHGARGSRRRGMTLRSRRLARDLDQRRDHPNVVLGRTLQDGVRLKTFAANGELAELAPGVLVFDRNLEGRVAEQEVALEDGNARRELRKLTVRREGF